MVSSLEPDCGSRALLCSSSAQADNTLPVYFLCRSKGNPKCLVVYRSMSIFFRKSWGPKGWRPTIRRERFSIRWRQSIEYLFYQFYLLARYRLSLKSWYSPFVATNNKADTLRIGVEHCLMLPVDFFLIVSEFLLPCLIYKKRCNWHPGKTSA